MSRPASGGNVAGLRALGNIDTLHRPRVRNPNGSISTVLSISFGTPAGEVLVPRVVGGKVVSPSAALANYRRTGKHLGIFDTPGHANAYAQSLHQDQARRFTSAKPAQSALALALRGRR